MSGLPAKAPQPPNLETHAMARILLTAENDDLRRYLSDKLKRAGHFVTRVSDYDVALTILLETYHDVLLTEVDSEDPRGVSFAHEARRIDPEMHVMFITGFSIVPLIADDEDEEGLHDRLGVPAHLNKLVDEVGRMLAA